MEDMNANNADNAGAAKKKKVLIFVVCYKAAHSIESVLNRIPETVWNNDRFSTEVLIIDDQSPDRTFYAAEDYSKRHPHRNVTVLYNPKSQGYGANQKMGFRYAIENHFNAIVLLHGDNRYAPERLPEMIGPILNDDADAVLGSRMIHKHTALKEGMPRYKWVGNQVLTFIQNRILKSHLSEFHSGYRAYSVNAIASIPFEHNSNGFDFDTDIIIQFLDTGRNITEIEVPTFYGNEIAGARRTCSTRPWQPQIGRSAEAAQAPLGADGVAEDLGDVSPAAAGDAQRPSTRWGRMKAAVLELANADAENDAAYARARGAAPGDCASLRRPRWLSLGDARERVGVADWTARDVVHKPPDTGAR